MIRFLSVLAVAMTAAAWVALVVGAHAAMIWLTASVGPVIALWVPFFTARLRQLGNPPIVDALEPRAIITGRRARVIRILGITGAVLGPAIGFYGFWFSKLPQLLPTVMLLVLVLLTVVSCHTLLVSISITARPITPQLADEMMEQIKAKAGLAAFHFLSILLVLCVVLTGFWNCSREVTASVMMGLWLASQGVFRISCHLERRKMIA